MNADPSPSTSESHGCENVKWQGLTTSSVVSGLLALLLAAWIVASLTRR